MLATLMMEAKEEHDGLLIICPKDTDPIEQESMGRMLDDAEVDYTSSRYSKSQVLRAVLHDIWKVDPKGFKTSDLHYKHMMAELIKHFKNKLAQIEEQTPKG